MKQYQYHIENNCVVIDKFIGTESFVQVPATIDNLPVQKIGDMAFAASSVQEVILPEGIESIGYRAFMECTHLHKIELPQSLKSIGVCAFWKCTALQMV